MSKPTTLWTYLNLVSHLNKIWSVILQYTLVGHLKWVMCYSLKSSINMLDVHFRCQIFLDKITSLLRQKSVLDIKKSSLFVYHFL